MKRTLFQKGMGRAQTAASDQAGLLQTVLDNLGEEGIRTLNEELEKRVRERTAELTQANRELTEKNQENETFIYGVSHDMRAPLVNLEGFTKELALTCQEIRGILAEGQLPSAQACSRSGRRCLALLDEDVDESIHFIQTGVRRLSGIIDALLRLSRAGRVEYQWQRVDVRSAALRIVESISATINSRGATVKVKDLSPVWGDPTAVEQVFANLITNALNYLDPERPGLIEVGSTALTGDAPPEHRPSMRATTEANGCGAHSNLLTFYVKDNGRGIPEACRAKVFQAFQRVHPGVAQGEGIGLTLVKRIVQRHGGKIWCESVEGAGTTFLVALPEATWACPARVSGLRS